MPKVWLVLAREAGDARAHSVPSARGGRVMGVEVINVFAAIGSVCLLLILCFCFFCGLKQISEWADAIQRDKQRRESDGE